MALLSEDGRGGVDVFGQFDTVPLGKRRGTEFWIGVVPAKTPSRGRGIKLGPDLLVDADRLGTDRPMRAPLLMQRLDLQGQTMDQLQTR